MITIYGIQSPYVARVRAALIFKNLPFQHINVNLRQKSAAFKALTLTETIPVMQDKDLVLCDSLHALLYLDERYPQYLMLGGTWPEKSKILAIIAAVDKISSYFPPLYLHKYYSQEQLRETHATFKGLQYDEEQKEDLHRSTTYRLNRIKDVMQKPFCLAQFSAADAALLALLRSMNSHQLPIDSFWQDWMNNLLQNPAIAQIFPAAEEKGVGEL